MLSDSLLRFRSNQALCVHGRSFTYEQLDDASRSIAQRLAGTRVGVLGGPTFETFAGIASTIRSGRTYVPFNIELPDEKLRQQLELAAPDTLLVDPTTVGLAQRVLGSVDWPMTVLCSEPIGSAAKRQHTYAVWDAASPPAAEEVDRETDTDLYQIFTSGTTGQPKRVRVTRNNVACYLKSINDTFDFGEEDRFSQFFKLSFDLSVHDMLVAWSNGASIFVPTQGQLIDPVGFARKNNLSVWFSVPSLARLAIMTKKLTPGSLPSLRHGLFCGEALTWDVARSFIEAAPNAAVTNLYGPTEATIAITQHRIDKRDEVLASNGQPSVPIGKPFPGQQAIVVDADMQPVPEGEIGELLLGGSQLAPGYCGDPEETSARFLSKRINGSNCTRWYRTGDLVRHHQGDLVFLGRDDTQIKFRGYRIELAEIESTLAEVASSPLAVVLPKGGAAGGSIQGLVGFVATPHRPLPDLRSELNDSLPRYMRPSEIVTIPEGMNWWNANGKVDRAAIRRWYDQNGRKKADDGNAEDRK